MSALKGMFYVTLGSDNDSLFRVFKKTVPVVQIKIVGLKTFGKSITPVDIPHSDGPLQHRYLNMGCL